MGLLNLFRRDEVTLMRPEEREQALQEREELFELAESLDFNPNVPSDWKKLQRIKRHLDTGKEFCVVKLMNTPGGNRKYVKVGFLDYFPGHSDVVEMAEEKWGGGRYAACCWPDSSHLLKTWTLEGEPRTPPEANNGSKSQVNNIKSALDAAAGEGLQQALEANPELKLRLGLAMIEKQLKVSLNGQSEDPIQNLINTAEQLRDLQTVLTGGSDSWKTVVADIGKSLGQPIVDLLKQSMTAGSPMLPPVQGKDIRPIPVAAQKPYTEIQEPQTHPVSGQTPVQNATNEGRVMGIGQQERGELNTEVEEGDQVDWASILLHTDWVDLEQRVHGNPASFVEWAVSEYNTGNQGASVLLSLFADNEPKATVSAISTGFNNLNGQGWVLSLVKAVGKGGDLEAGERIVRYFNTSEGLRWVTEVHNLLERMESGDREPVIAPVAASDPSREQFLEELHFSENGHRGDGLI